MKVLVSGKDGFLLKNTLKDYKWKFTTLIQNGSHSNSDLVIHFASPSDNEGFNDLNKLVKANIDLTITAVEEANRNNCKLIFASSLAVDNDCTEYSMLKKVAELYIETHCNDYVILRIPRVYGSSRNKGLMKDIKNNNIKDWMKEIEYIDIEDFKLWFSTILNKNGIQYYSGKYYKETIKQIKEKYCIS
jgi:nucleoside-diphosphate-sugar epimerase